MIVITILSLWRIQKYTFKSARQNAKKEMDESYKAFDAHRDEEAKGFVKENDIVKIGTQYKANWTHLPR